ncbi:hypothetical protein J2S43_005295 [Catenuloplanes nepalensis]|uniref:Uncharacterized protein n=1 Tax=Catenuloplanes nepalensis TaxID=587533 RepID=A0ABT9MZB2_9ACTN|nr:hypothetical protein [Catenuloplanes nepalensis]MDP9796783.1 hypothetical protein [Catenuloplanes nepalensis]
MRLGLPLPALMGLALIAVPRAVLHDLEIIHEGTFVNALLVAVPLLIWVVVVVAARVPRPFPALLVVGAFYGIGLAVVHQVLWSVDADLGGRLPPWAEQGVIRTFAVLSSLFTGLLTGAVTGLVAWACTALIRRRDYSTMRD